MTSYWVQTGKTTHPLTVWYYKYAASLVYITYPVYMGLQAPTFAPLYYSLTLILMRVDPHPQLGADRLGDSISRHVEYVLWVVVVC